MLMKRLLSVLIPGQVESRQVVSGAEEGPRRPEKSQFLTSATGRGRGRLAVQRRHSTAVTQHRQINLFLTRVLAPGASLLVVPVTFFLLKKKKKNKLLMSVKLYADKFEPIDKRW